MHHTTFTRDGFRAYRDNTRPGPVQMLNLVKLRDMAVYDDEHSATGTEAYGEYGRLSADVFARVGGRIAWRGEPEQVLIGPEEETWDLCFIAEYPSAAAFVEMQKDPDYAKAVPHRQAAVLDSRLIRLMPLPAGGEFAG
ncbi:DUF1330 domain-containing protein [Arenibacterium sp. CAU 1754]